MAYQDLKSLPNFFKHVVVAIYKSGDISGSPADKFQSCLNIARAQLVRGGYFAPGSESGPVTNIKFTPKGARRVLEHRSEGASKSAEFDKLVPLVEGKDTAAPAGAGVKPKELSSSEKKELKAEVQAPKKRTAKVARAATVKKAKVIRPKRR